MFDALVAHHPHRAGISAMLNKYSTTVVFERPNENLVRKWQLACTGKIAHVVVMPSHNKETLDEFVESLVPMHKAGEVCIDMHIGQKLCLCEKPECGAAAARPPPSRKA